MGVHRRILDRNVGTLVVVDYNQEPIGILTDRDLTIRVFATSVDPIATTVEDVVTAP